MKNKKGFTVVEVVVAAFILAVAFIAIGKVISSSSTNSVKVANKAKAADLMAKLMEEIKHIPIKVYEEKMPDLFTSTENVKLPEEFYQDVTKDLNELKDSGDKEFWFSEVSAKAECNDYKQIIELHISCQIDWREKGGQKDTSQREQSLRDYAVIFNSEAKLD